MNLGIRIILCFVVTILTIIAERGIPAKFLKNDIFIYTSEFLLLMFISSIE